ncbi:MAG: LytR/AlgR family response regulator transcription factor, partial [Flavobacteriales bacterium]
MIKVVLIDDEPLARSIVAEYLATYPEFEIMHQCNDGFEGVKSILHHQPDLIFLDIQMPKLSGFEMLELLDQKPSVIFTTAFDEYAMKAFEANATDYLLKPFSKERFDKAIQKWLNARVAEQVTPITDEMLESVKYPEEQNSLAVFSNHLVELVRTASTGIVAV